VQIADLSNYRLMVRFSIFLPIAAINSPRNRQRSSNGQPEQVADGEAQGLYQHRTQASRQLAL